MAHFWTLAKVIMELKAVTKPITLQMHAQITCLEARKVKRAG